MQASLPPFDPSSYSFDSVALNVLVVWVIQRLKLAEWFPWVTEATPAMTKLVSVLAATFTAAGMAVSWTVEQGSGTLVISGITGGSIVTFLWLIVKNVAFQHIIYKAGFKPNAPSNS